MPSLLSETHTEVTTKRSELILSRFESIALLFCYGLFLFFQLYTHRCVTTCALLCVRVPCPRLTVCSFCLFAGAAHQALGVCVCARVRTHAPG